MTDYSKGKIYRIVSDKTDEVYIGSTVQTLERRFIVHKSYFKTSRYCSSAEILKHGDARIELIRDFPCNSEQELEKEEDKYILDCCKVVNCNRASRTRAEYYQENRAEIAEKTKQYREANRAEIAEQQKQWYEANRERINQKFDCPCGGKYTKSHKSRHEKSKMHQDWVQKK